MIQKANFTRENLVAYCFVYIDPPALLAGPELQKKETSNHVAHTISFFSKTPT